MANVVHASVYSVASALAQHRGEGGERLVEPQVVPPPHGDQVAEPHVRHLVQHRLGAPLVGRAGDLAAEDVVLQEGHGAGVLHRAGVELGHEQLVVLAERVRHAEVVVVEAEALLGLGEQPLGVHELARAMARQKMPSGMSPCSSL